MTQDKLDRPEDHLDLCDISLSPTLTQIKMILERNTEQLVEAREDLKERWRQAENRMLIHARINKYKNKADKVGKIDLNNGVFPKWKGNSGNLMKH